MRTKKGKAIGMVLVMLMSVVVAYTLPALATGTVVSIGDIDALPDGTVTKPIMANDVNELASVMLNITYNSSVVHVTNVAAGTGNAMMMPIGNPDNTTGVVRISAIDPYGKTGDVIIANVTFKAVGDAGTFSDLNISITKFKNLTSVIPHTVDNGTFTVTGEAPECTPDMEVNKTVLDGTAWVKEINANMSDNVTFRIWTHNNATCCNLTNITVYDYLSDSLKYVNGSATPFEPNGTAYHSGYMEMWWNFTGPLAYCENITIEFNASVVGYGADWNSVSVEGWCNETKVSEDSSVDVNVPQPYYPVHNLDTGENFSTIQAAIDDSDTDNGDTITVDPGTYTENVDVTKQLTIMSTSGNHSDTIVETADTDESVFDVTVDYVNISGFTVTGASFLWSEGIFLDGVEHCNISNNNVSNNTYGIILEDSNDNTLMNNTVDKNGEVGIYLDYSSNNTLTNNTILDSELIGAYLWESSNNTLNDNTFVNNGLFVVDSYNNTVEDNTVNGRPLAYLEDAADQTITNAGQVILVNCDNITAEKSEATLDLSNASAGVELWGTNNSEIKNFDSSNNFFSILLIESNSNTLMDATASNVGFGIYLWNSSSNTLTNITASGGLEGYYWWGLPEFLSEDESHNNVVEDFTISSYPTTISFTYSGELEIYSVEDPEPDPVGKGNIGKYLEAYSWSGDSWIALNVSYDDPADLTNVVETSLLLYHWNGADWEEIPDSGVNTAENYVYGNVTDFSQIAPFGTSLAPYTTGHDPAPNETNVPVDTDIIVHVKNDVAGVNISTIVMTVDGDDVTDVTNITGDIYDYTLKYDPPADFVYQKVVNVTIDAADLSTPPYVMDTDEYSFTIGPAPQVNAVSPTDGATKVSRTTTISATFSEAMNKPSAEEAFSISPSVSGAFSWDDNTMIFKPSSELAYNTKYTVTISTAARNEAGNPLADDYSWSFTTKSRSRVGGGGGGPSKDSDGDGYSDIQEMIAGTDENDPCDPDSKCAACLASKPAAAPTPTPTPTPTVTPTPTIPPVVTTPTPTPTEEPGFEAVFAIAGLLAVAYLVLRRKSK